MPTMTSAGYVPPKEEKPRKRKPPKKNRRRRGPGAATIAALLFFLLAAMGCAATLFVFSQTQPFADVFCPNVSLSGYPLAGMSYADAQALLRSMTQEKVENWRYELVWQGASYVVSAADVSLGVDEEQTLAPLWAAGRESGMLARFLALEKLRREPVDGEPVIRYELEGASGMLSVLASDVDCESVDATVTYVPGSATPFRYTEEEIGYSLDAQPLLDAIERSILALTPGRTVVQPRETQPNTYLAELQNATVLRARTRLTLEADEAAAKNAIRAAQKLNGLYIAPGESVSFNEIVGARTEAAGYVVAPESAYGDHVYGVGGGVCQVSSALYQAALLADLKIISRSAAAYPVGYCAAGQEAAVSGQVDLVIANDTTTPIFVLMRVYNEGNGGSVLDTQIIGARLGERYRLESTAVQTEKLEEPVYIRDSEGRYAVYSDERVPVGEAKPGIEVTVTRIRLNGSGGEAGRENISVDSYAAVPPTIYVGVQKR